MAGASLLTLIDKIAVVLDDVALMTKVAAKKTAGVLGDDLALNAQQVSGVKAEREIPVVLAVAKGSAVNKLILVPLALAASAFLPWIITPLLMLGGAYLCFEGFEKVWHSFIVTDEELRKEHRDAAKELLDETVDLVTLEQEKIKGAIRTDFILSAEIIVIALGTVQAATFSQQVMVVSAIAAVMTIGVYGLVAAIVKLDDVGLYLLRAGSSKQVQNSFTGKVQRTLGRALLSFAPKLMKSLAVIGTVAMFLVGGSILVHGLADAHHALVAIEQMVGHSLTAWPSFQQLVISLVPLIFDALIGLIAGAIALLVVSLVKKLFFRKAIG
ncbi:MAG: DUF808 domain-containing protein [Colwellia sp.]|nr:DUF808 domain-containing protein [Colwellia sp.]MCW8865954.1 DUF808 domain-containing protein [Colwellia sp.]MCW9082355.1 DUF808 domain-containing protein [Colwellia sp.]